MNAATDIDINAVSLFAPEPRMASVDIADQKSGTESFSELLQAAPAGSEISKQKQSVSDAAASREAPSAQTQTAASRNEQRASAQDPPAKNTSQSGAEVETTKTATPDQNDVRSRQFLPGVGKAGPLSSGSVPDRLGQSGVALSGVMTEVLPQSKALAGLKSPLQTATAALSASVATSGTELSLARESALEQGMQRSLSEVLAGASRNRLQAAQIGASQMPANQLTAERQGELRTIFTGLTAASTLAMADLRPGGAQQTQSLSQESAALNPAGVALLRDAQFTGRETLSLKGRTGLTRGSMVQGEAVQNDFSPRLTDMPLQRGSMVDGLSRGSWVPKLATVSRQGNAGAALPTAPPPPFNLAGGPGQELGLLPTTMRLPSGFELSGGSAQGQLLSSVHQPAWAQELAQQTKFMVRDALKFAELKLTPANLGTVEVVVKQEDQQTTLMFFAKNPAVREALEASLQRLQKSFDEDGLRLEGAFVSDQSLAEHREQAAENFKEDPSLRAQTSGPDGSPADLDSKLARPIELPGGDRLLDIWA